MDFFVQDATTACVMHLVNTRTEPTETPERETPIVRGSFEMGIIEKTVARYHAHGDLLNAADLRSLAYVVIRLLVLAVSKYGIAPEKLFYHVEDGHRPDRSGIIKPIAEAILAILRACR